MFMNKSVIILGYSGHAYVVCDIFRRMGIRIEGYCETEEKNFNPFTISYLGSERELETLKKGAKSDFFVAVGDNSKRKHLFSYLCSNDLIVTNAIHPSVTLSEYVKIGKGLMIGPGAIVNSLAEIGDAVICNTGSIIEHECVVGSFVHIAPGAVLCGNVKIGEGSFVGANSVIRQGVEIGKNVLIGAGSVVVKNVPDNCKIWGNPAEKR